MADTPLELWGGIECTVNRVGDRYFDQILSNGHEDRLDDLDRIAQLGLKTVRYPVLWERVEPDHPDVFNWRWSDERLSKLQALGITPLVGLLHHGSGPRYTALNDPDFPQKLGRYARAVAERYPWVTTYTPVNEPLTTARFSGLYGRWYPHGANATIFIECLLRQCLGIAAAMREIRKIQPRARLLLTEDIAQISSTPFLAYQAAHENERRWLSIDLLLGRVTPEHRLWRFLLRHGADRVALEKLNASPCPPDLIGMNHYVTSNRYLDENLEAYPPSTYGGNGRDTYADLETVRVAAAPQTAPDVLMHALWDRYRIPLAVTECHLNAHREEQMRWLNEIWDCALKVRREGVDLRAVTTWSMFGSHDWNTVVTRDEGYYENGVYDIRAPQPRPTALAQMAKSLAHGESFHHPILQRSGWWTRDVRALYPLASQTIHSQVPFGGVLITGAHGALGRTFVRLCEERAIPYMPVARDQLDIANPLAVKNVLHSLRPWAIINCAGFARIDDAEEDPATCYRENVSGPLLLGEACAQRAIPLLTFSSDLIFNGRSRSPYVESSQPDPLNVYGHSQAEVERRLHAMAPRSLIVRTSNVFNPGNENDFLGRLFRALMNGRRFEASADVWVSPTYMPDLVHAALDLLLDGEGGIWHLTHEGRVTWVDFAVLAAQYAGLNASLIEGRPSAEMGYRALRPSYSVLRSERGQLLGRLETALAQYVQAVGIQEFTVV